MTKEKPKFQDLVIETGRQIGEFPSAVRGAQLFTVLNPSQMMQFTLLCQLFRKHKILSEAEAISIACRHFLNSVDDKDEEV
jgi:hypothetical protein